MRKRSENVGCGSYMRGVSAWQRSNDAKNEPCDPDERFPIWLRRSKKTDNKNSIAFEQQYYPERYS